MRLQHPVHACLLSSSVLLDLREPVRRVADTWRQVPLERGGFRGTICEISWNWYSASIHDVDALVWFERRVCAFYMCANRVSGTAATRRLRSQ